MTSTRKADLAFVLAVAAALGLSLAAGLVLAPAPAPAPAPPPVPSPPRPPGDFDPRAVDARALADVEDGTTTSERQDLEALAARGRSALERDVPGVVEAEEALAGLAAFGEKAVPLSLAWLEDENPIVRRAGARLAGRIASPLPVPALAARLEDEAWEVQADVAWALGRIGDRSAVVDLLVWRKEMANGPRHPVAKIRVAEALLRLGNTSAVEWLMDGMFGKVFEGALASRILREQAGGGFGFDREAARRDTDAAARKWCLWWQDWKGFFRPAETSPDRTQADRLAARILEEMRALDGSRYYTLYWGRPLLARLGTLSVDYLLEALYEGDPSDPRDASFHIRMNAAESLGMMVEMKVQPAPDRARIAPHLNAVLSTDAHASARGAAARALAVMGDRRSVAPLLHRLEDDPDPSVRIEAARTLEALGFASAVPRLEAFLPGGPGENEALRFETRAALNTCRRESPLPPVVEGLATALEAGDAATAEEALARLGALTGRRSTLPPAEDAGAREKLLASWRRQARFDVLVRRLIALHHAGETGRSFEILTGELASYLGPEAPPRPSDASKALDYFTGFQDLWTILGGIREAIDADELFSTRIVNGAEALKTVTGRPNAMHPRTVTSAGVGSSGQVKSVLISLLERWESWARRNGPGCLPE